MNILTVNTSERDFTEADFERWANGDLSGVPISTTGMYALVQGLAKLAVAHVESLRARGYMNQPASGDNKLEYDFAAKRWRPWTQAELAKAAELAGVPVGPSGLREAFGAWHEGGGVSVNRPAEAFSEQVKVVTDYPQLEFVCQPPSPDAPFEVDWPWSKVKLLTHVHDSSAVELVRFTHEQAKEWGEVSGRLKALGLTAEQVTQRALELLKQEADFLEGK